MNNSVMYMLERAAARSPLRTALADEEESITYLEYLHYSVRLGKRISDILKGKKEDDLQTSCSDYSALCCRPCCVLIDRNLLSIIAFMGIAYSGNFYVPLDPTLPSGRLETILRELSPALLVDARRGSGVTSVFPVSCGVPILSMKEVMDSMSIEEDDDQSRLCALLEEAEKLREGIIDTDPLYAIFTSGSTGVPKGVLVPHRAVLDLVGAFNEVFGFQEDAVFGNQAPFDFDVSVKDIYNSLFCGGRVEVIPHKLFVMPAMLIKYLADRGVNTIIWAVSAVRIVSDLRALDEEQAENRLALRYVMFSGETMPVKSISYWIRHFPKTIFVNLYGPTEITCNCTYYILDRQYGDNEMLPIGRAFPNTRVFLLETDGGEEDESDTAGASEVPRIILPSEPDRRGEICVEGTGVALGYWNNPARTSESFTGIPGAPGSLKRIYRTGDLGYYSKEGELFFASRADNQIKHMGHRIELGEIETALNAIEFIDVSCCLYDRRKEKILCFYQVQKEKGGKSASGNREAEISRKPEAAAERREIILALSNHLPKYMRPNKYIRLEQMPLNAHAKIDRHLLMEWYEKGVPDQKQ